MFKESIQLAFALMICFSAAACSKAPFSVQPLQVSDIVMTSNSDDPTVPKQMQFTVQACMTDAASTSRNTVASSPFTLTSDGVDTHLQSDQKGCIYWPEKVSFNLLDTETYIQFSRTITGQGDYQGNQTVSFAMDPWRNSPDGFVDLKVTPMDQVMKELAAKTQNNASTPTIFTQNVAVHTYNTQNTKSGTSITAQLTLSPYLTRKGLDSNDIREPITQGNFTVELFLLELNKNGNTNDTSLLAHTNQSTNASDGVINFNTQLSLAHIPKLDSQIALAFRLTFGSGAKALTQESMLMMDQLITQETLPIQTVTQSLDALVSASAAAKLSVVSNPATAAGFRLDSINVVPGGPTATSASTNAVTSVSARITACVKDSLSLSPIVDHEFQMSLVDPAHAANPKTFNVTSDSAGCLNWQTEIAFDGYAPEQWYSRALILHSATAPYLDLEQSIPVNLNPSETGSLFFWDSRNGTPPSTGHAQTPADEASLVVREFTYTFTGRDFELDRSMNLVMNRHYQIQFNPLVEFKKTYTTETKDQPVQNGRLNIKVMILDGDTPLSLYSGSAAVIDGEVITDITLPFEIARFPEVLNRNQLILEVSDTETHSTLKSESLATPFIALNTWGSGGLEQTNQSITAKLSSFRPIAGSSVNSLNLVTDQKLTENDLSKIGFANSNEIQDFISNPGTNTLESARFCSLIYSSIEDVGACQSKPSAYLTFAAKTPKDGLLGFTSEVSTNVSSLSASATQAWTTSQDQSTNQSYTSGSTISGTAKIGASASVGAGFQFFGNGGTATASTGAEGALAHDWNWYTGNVLSKDQVQAKGYTVSQVNAMVVERVTLQTFVDPGKCLSVSSTKTEDSANLYFCTSPHSGPTLNESWYYVHPQFLSSAMLVDANNVAPMSFTAVIRGAANFETFKNAIQDKNNTIVFSKNFSNPEDLQTVLIKKFHLDKVDNGVITKILGN